MPTSHDSRAPASPPEPLRAVVARSGSLHTVDDLKSKGLARVRVLSQSQLQDSIDLAIHRTLSERLAGIELAESALRGIEERVRAQFATLLERGLVTDARPTEEAPRSAPVPVPSALKDEARRLEELVTGGAGAPLTADPRALPEELDILEKRMASSLSRLLGQDLRKELAGVEDSARRQVELLEQRIAKLARALESTDRVLGHLQRAREGTRPVAAAPLAGDSLGLDPESPLYERKSQLLEALFQANLELRERRRQ